MKRVLMATLGVAAVCALTATNALAGPINVRPVPVNVGAETPLQTVFANIGSTINVNTDQEVFAYFASQATGISAAQLIIEIAGNAVFNEYGIYKLGDPTTRATVFDGSDAAGTKAIINFNGDGSVQVVDLTHGVFGLPVANFGSVFGFYLATVQGILYSEDLLNPGGLAQALVFAGKGDNVTLPAGPVGGGGDINHYYLAWEDVVGGDYDFNDGVFIVESITGVPEPGLIGLLGMGFLGVAMSLRRRLRA